MTNKFKNNPDMTKYDYMYECSKNNMNDIALTFFNRKITYEELHESIDKYCKMLISKGVREGDRIGICTFNSPEAVYLIYALDKIGALDFGLNPFDRPDKVRKDARDINPKMIITTDYSYGNFKDLDKTLNFETLVYDPSKDSRSFVFKSLYKIGKLKNKTLFLPKELLLTSALRDGKGVIIPELHLDPEKTSDIMFTGGSTGVHKGVELSSRGINYVVEGMRYLYDDDFFKGKTYLGQIPFGSMAFGRLLLHVALTNDMTYAATLKAMPKDFYEEMVRTKANVVAGGPPHWTSLIETDSEGNYIPRRDLKEGSLSNLVLATSGGEQKKDITVPAINAAFKKCGSTAVLGDGLGATETWGNNILNSGHNYTEGLIGSPISTLEVRLIDENGNIVKKGEDGLLQLSGPTVMNGYYHNEEETNHSIIVDENGKRWFNTGDILQEVSDNMYKYKGRKKRLFVCNVDNIYPEEIENLLTTMPEIREVVVTPISDDIQQFIPSYHISLYSDQIDFDDFEKRMFSLIEEKVCHNALPQKIEYFTEPLVRMNNSKIDINYYKERDTKNNPKTKMLKNE